MALVGRKPKPTHLKLVSGNPGKRRIEQNEPKPAVGVGAMPRGMLNADGQALWKELRPKLERLGLLTEVDGPAFALLCEWWGIARQAAREVRELESVWTVDGQGRERRHPALVVLKQATEQFCRLAGEFGLTPAMRARLKVPEPENSDEFFGF